MKARPNEYVDHTANQVHEPLVLPLAESRMQLTYSDFVNKELSLFSASHNLRSIPSLMDGLKPAQRKVNLSVHSVVG